VNEYDHPGPIPSGVVRVSVRHGELLFLCDYPVERIMEVVAEFETFASPAFKLHTVRGKPIGAEGAIAVANFAAHEQNPTLVGGAALWLFLFEPGQLHRDNEGRLNDLIERDGAAWIICAADELGINWTYSLCAADLSKYGDDSEPPIISASVPHSATIH
jgi:hypothetical protein